MENYRQPTFLRRKMVPQRDTTKMFAKILRFVAESLEIKGKNDKPRLGQDGGKCSLKSNFCYSLVKNLLLEEHGRKHVITHQALKSFWTKRRAAFSLSGWRRANSWKSLPQRGWATLFPCPAGCNFRISNALFLPTGEVHVKAGLLIFKFIIPKYYHLLIKIKVRQPA